MGAPPGNPMRVPKAHTHHNRGSQPAGRALPRALVVEGAYLQSSPVQVFLQADLGAQT